MILMADPYMTAAKFNLLSAGGNPSKVLLKLGLIIKLCSKSTLSEVAEWSFTSSVSSQLSFTKDNRSKMGCCISSLVTHLCFRRQGARSQIRQFKCFRTKIELQIFKLILLLIFKIFQTVIKN